MDTKTHRKIVKAQSLTDRAQTAIVDLPDWLEHTDPAAWDLDVLAAHAKVLEAAGCHLRRLIADPEIQRLAA